MKLNRQIPNLVVSLVESLGSIPHALRHIEENPMPDEQPYGEAYLALLMLDDGALLHGDGLRTVRWHLGDLTQGQMAACLGVHLNTYAQWERGTRATPPTAQTAILWLYLGSHSAAQILCPVSGSAADLTLRHPVI